MIVDAHMHLWDRVHGRLGAQKVKPLRDGLILVGSRKIQGMPSWFTSCRSSAELAIAAFDEAGVDIGVVTQEYLDGNQNDYLLQVTKKYSDRFFVHALLEFTKPFQLKNEFRKVVKQGFRGIKCPAMFFPQLKIFLDKPKFMEIWEEMEHRDMVLSIDLAMGAIQVPEMKRILKRFPHLKVAIGHFGMATDKNWMSQIRLAEFENVYIECGGIIWLFRKQGPPFQKAEAKIKQAVCAIGPRKIMWGSDYPRTMVDFTYRQSMEFVVKGCTFLDVKEKADFLGGNAVRLYGLKYPSKKRKPRVHITEI